LLVVSAACGQHEERLVLRSPVKDEVNKNSVEPKAVMRRRAISKLHTLGTSLRLPPLGLIIDYSEGRFANRPYNYNRNSTSGQHPGKFGQPHGIDPTFRFIILAPSTILRAGFAGIMVFTAALLSPPTPGRKASGLTLPCCRPSL